MINSDENSLKTRARAPTHAYTQTRTHSRLHKNPGSRTWRGNYYSIKFKLQQEFYFPSCNWNAEFWVFGSSSFTQDTQHNKEFFTRNHCSSFHAQYNICLKNSRGNIRFVMHCVPSGTTLCSLIGHYQHFIMHCVPSGTTLCSLIGHYQQFSMHCVPSGTTLCFLIGH